MQESKRPNILEMELAGEMLTSMLHAREDVAAAVLAEPREEQRYQLAFEGFSQLWDDLRNQYGDDLPRIMAEMTSARQAALRQQVQQRERLERGR